MEKERTGENQTVKASGDAGFRSISAGDRYSPALSPISCTLLLQEALPPIPRSSGFHGHVFKNLKPRDRHLGNNNFISMSLLKFLGFYTDWGS